MNSTQLWLSSISFSTKRGLLVVYVSTCLLSALLMLTGLIPGWGLWYSGSTALREQTDALLTGTLAISRSPLALEHNLAWSEGGVHQVWGLGVPFWRSIFEFCARLTGGQMFPDRLAFVVAAGLTTLVLVKMFFVTNAEQTGTWPFIETLVGCTLLALFPPFLGLLRSAMTTYEEILAYTYLFGLLLIVLLVRCIRSGSKLDWVLLCVVSGLGGMVRPTLIFYGSASVVIAWFANWAKNRGSEQSPRLVHTACISSAFLCGAAILFTTNLIRFGDGFEFGHRLNLHHGLSANMYATRFDYPFEDESFTRASTELLGALFLSTTFNGSDYYRPGLFPGQSATPRFRELYLKTFDWSYLALIGGALIASIFACCLRTRRLRLIGTEEGYIGLWSLLATAQLFLFYLRAPSISSRYMLDFAPAFAAGALVSYRAFQSACSPPMLKALLTTLIVAWWAWQVKPGQNSCPHPVSLTKDELALIARNTRVETLPSERAEVRCDSPSCGIPLDCEGWDRKTGEVKPLVTLFVWKPEFLQLTIAPGSSADPGMRPDDVRAKIGLEFLVRKSICKTSTGWEILFSGPTSGRYQTGLQVAFIAFSGKQHFADTKSPWTLQRAQWKAVKAKENA